MTEMFKKIVALYEQHCYIALSSVNQILFSDTTAMRLYEKCSDIGQLWRMFRR